MTHQSTPATPSPVPAEMPESFRAQLDAALSRPILLDQRALDGVRAARGFRLRAQTPVPQASAPQAAAQQDLPYQYGGDGSVAVLDVQGPLAQRAWSCWMFAGDGYDAIAERVQSALADRKVASVLLRVDSPGGEVAGCFEAVRSIRAAMAASDKPLVVYVDEMAASAAYAIASAATEIITPESAYLGSIGVITAVTKIDKQLAADGVEVHVISSGARKADGHPAVTATKAELASIQSEIDALAQQFASLVAEGRGKDAAKWLSLEAACFLGAEAVRVGLADRVGGFDMAVSRAQELGAAKQSAGRVPARKGSKMSINLIGAAMGLKSDADENTVGAKAQELAAMQRDLLAITGGSSPDEAMGTVKAWKASHARVEGLEAELKLRAEQAEKRERDEIVSAMRNAGKLTVDMEAELIPTMSVAQLRAFSKTAGRVVPVGKDVKEPEVKDPPGSLVSPEGKRYEEMSNAERNALAKSNRALFNAMRDDAKNRKAI